MLVLLGGTIAYLPFYLQDHKADLETAATEALGRAVAIDSVTLGWLSHPRPGLSIALKGLRVSNPAWDTDGTLGPHLLEAERVDLLWQLRALLHREVRIDQLVIRNARLMLQQTTDGRNNWQLGAKKGTGKGSGHISLRVPRVQVLDSDISFAAAKGPVRRAEITRLQLDGLGAEPLVLQAELVINATPLSLSGKAGAEDARAGARWPFELLTQSADTRVELNGSAPAPFATTGLDAKLQVQGPTAAPLGQIAGINGLPAGPFRLETDLSWDGQTLEARAINGSSQADGLPAPLTISDGEISVPLHGPWSVQLTGKLGDQPGALQLTSVALPQGAAQTPDTKTAGALAIKATLADGRFDGELQLAAKNDAPARLSGTLNAGSVSLDAFTKDDVTKHTKQDTAEQGSAESAATKPKTSKPPTWVDKPLPFDLLTRLDADLEFAVEALTWQRITMRGLQARAKLRGGRFELDGVRLALPGLTVTGQAVVDASSASPASPKTPALTLNLKTDRVDLPQALSMLAQRPKLGGSINGLSLDAAASGTTPATLIRTLSSTLEAQSLRLLPPAKRGRTATAIEFTRPKLRIDAGAAVSFQTGLAMASQDGSERTMDLTLTGGTLADLLPGGRSWPRIDVLAQTRIDKHQLSIRGHLGPLAAIRSGRDLMLDLRLTEDTDLNTALTGSLTGTLARLDGLTGSQLQAQLTGKSLAVLHPGLPPQPFAAKARLRGQTGQLELLDIEASTGSSDLAGEVLVGLGKPARIDATLNAEVLDLTPFFPQKPDRKAAPDRAEAPTGAHASNAQPLPFDGLKAVNGSLKLRAGQVQLNDIGMDNGTLDITLDAGHLVLSGDAEQDSLSVALELRPAQNGWEFDLHQRGKLDLGRLIKAEKKQTLPNDVTATDEIRLRGVGASVPELLRSADGRVELVLGAGQLNRKASQLPLGGVVVSLLETVNPTRINNLDIRRDLLSLKCAVMQFDIADGIATSKRGLALQTDNLNVLGGGAIKLETGEIEMRFKTIKRTGVGLSLLGVADRFIVLDGTLTAPHASIDSGDLAVEGAAAWATGGLSLVAGQITRRLTAFGNPCNKVLKRDAPGAGP